MPNDKLVKFIEDLPGDSEEISKLIPYFKHAFNAYKWVQKKRIALFLKSIDLSSDSSTEKEKDKFKKYANGSLGKELLAEFSDSVLRTSSQTAIASLGILYSDVDNQTYEISFKRLACSALQGTTDYLIETFLSLCDLTPISENGPYPLSKISQEVFDSNNKIKEQIENAENAFAYINDFTRRGMFLPDHSTSRYGGEEWSVYFGVTEVSLKLKDLLLKAKNL